jgi:hypothetical protein
MGHTQGSLWRVVGTRKRLARSAQFSHFILILDIQAMYRDPDGATKPMETLNRTCLTHPVHLVLGGIPDFV